MSSTVCRLHVVSSSRRRPTLAPSPAVIEVKPEEQKSAEPTPEQNALIADLHWLIHQGHVLEFADGRMDTAKKPLPRPAKQEKKKVEEKPGVEGEAAVVTETVPPAEGAIKSAAEISAPVETVAEPARETPAPTEPAAPETGASVSSETISSTVEPTAVPKTIPPTEEVPSPS